MEGVLKDLKIEFEIDEPAVTKRLAYAIEGHETGTYLYYTLDMEREEFFKLSNRLNRIESVLRYLCSKEDIEVKICYEEADSYTRLEVDDDGEEILDTAEEFFEPLPLGYQVWVASKTGWNIIKENIPTFEEAKALAKKVKEGEYNG